MSETTAVRKRAASPASVAVKLKLIDEIFRTFRVFGKYLMYVLVAVYVTSGLTAMAGTKTDIAILFTLMKDSGPGSALTASILLNFALGIILFRKHKLCQDHIERFGPMMAQRERDKDPTRTSSGLTSRGQTPPEDH
jgi:hypothetical protein